MGGRCYLRAWSALPGPGSGGTVAAEHGIGKIKRKWLPLQASALQFGMMRAMKRELDPQGLLAPGNVL